MRNIIVNGRLAANVTRQISKQGTEFINFSIANNEYGDPKSSDGQPQTQWFRVTSFLPQHVSLAPYLKKGKPITVSGRYSNRLYQNQNTGQYNISNEIIASEIWFEIGAERQATQGNTTVTEEQAVAHVNTAIDEIPQATSSRMTTPVQVISDGGVEDDDLPF